MAANTDPIFALTPKTGLVQISTANTARDGTGTMGTVVTAGANGSRVDCITIVATGTTTAGVVRLFIYDGSNVRLWKEILVSAITPSTTVKVFSSILNSDSDGDLPLVLQAAYQVRASTHNAETFNVAAQYGNF